MIDGEQNMYLRMCSPSLQVFVASGTPCIITSVSNAQLPDDVLRWRVFACTTTSVSVVVSKYGVFIFWLKRTSEGRVLL